jgi:redox-sensing transcriptional repressor
VAVVGLGNLGRALANSQGFRSRGFRVAALFDVEPSLVGTRIQGLTIHHLDDFEELAASDRPSIGVIATPAAAAQDVADRMVAAGVGSLLNFAPRVLTVPPQVLLRYVDLSIELQVMSFYLSHRDQTGSTDGLSPLSIAVGLTPGPP